MRGDVRGCGGGPDVGRAADAGAALRVRAVRDEGAFSAQRPKKFARRNRRPVRPRLRQLPPADAAGMRSSAGLPPGTLYKGRAATRSRLQSSRAGPGESACLSSGRILDDKDPAGGMRDKSGRRALRAARRLDRRSTTPLGEANSTIHLEPDQLPVQPLRRRPRDRHLHPARRRGGRRGNSDTDSDRKAPKEAGLSQKAAALSAAGSPGQKVSSP